MKKLSKWIFVITAVTGLSACGGNDDDPVSTGVDNQTSMLAPGAEPDSGLESSVLDGTWVSNCAQADPQDVTEGFELVTIVFTGDISDSTIESFSDSDCSVADDSAIFTVQASLEFPEGSVNTEQGDASFVNLTPESYLIDGVQPTSEEFALISSTGGFDTEYGIFIIALDGKLYFGGDDLDGSSEDNRPRTVDTAQFFTLQ